MPADPAPANDDLPERLRAARSILGLQQREMADQMRIYFGTLNRWETGAKRPPAFATTLAAGAAAEFLFQPNADLAQDVAIATMYSVLDVLDAPPGGYVATTQVEASPTE